MRSLCKDPLIDYTDFASVLYLRLFYTEFYTEEFLGWRQRRMAHLYVRVRSLGLLSCSLPLGDSSLFHNDEEIVIESKNSDRLWYLHTIMHPPLLRRRQSHRGSPPQRYQRDEQLRLLLSGLGLPHSKALDLIQWYETKKVGFVDVLTEGYADKNP